MNLRRAAPPRGPRLAPWLAPLPALALLALATGAFAQPPAPPRDDPYQDILIEGIGFSKLILAIEPTPELERFETFTRFVPMLERNLCWSGLFNLTGGKTTHCAIQGTPARVDMRLSFKAQDNALRVRLQDTGPEGLVLFERSVATERWVTEDEVIELVNAMAERITGRPGILGSTIAFVIRQPGYSKVVVATDTHGRSLKLISSNNDINLLPHWAPNGDALVYTVLGRDGSGVYFHNLVESPGEDRKSRFLTPRSGLNSGGAFSRKGDRVVFTMSQNGVADLYEYEFRSGGTPRRLTFREGIETSADWSPDDKTLVFVSDRSGTPQVYLLDMETGEDLRLTFDSIYNADPKWSPDGELILFTKRVDGRDQIHIMDKYGENVRPVTAGRFDSEQASWSPDGKQIVFTSNRTGEFKLYVVSADGTGLRRLTRTPDKFEESNPAWTARRFHW